MIKKTKVGKKSDAWRVKGGVMGSIDQIRQASSIVEIAGQYTKLERRGRKHVGLCPFHSEKTPSFTVDEEKQLFHCFGCGVGGDIFSLIMEKEKIGFPEALKYLAEKYKMRLARQDIREVKMGKATMIDEQDLANGRYRIRWLGSDPIAGPVSDLEKIKELIEKWAMDGVPDKTIAMEAPRVLAEAIKTLESVDDELAGNEPNPF